MSAKNKVRVNIAGSEYNISSDEDVSYIRILCDEIDERMRLIMESNPNISTLMAAVLTALDYSDKAKKAEESSDNMRFQIKDYLEDAARSRIDADEARRETERLNREIFSLRSRLSKADPSQTK